MLWQTCAETIRKGSQLALLSGGMLASFPWPAAALGQEPPRTFRSVDDVRARIPDEQGRPFRRETSSHRGWEIREDQFTIAANTSLADARWAARQVMQVRGELAPLLDQFTKVHHQPDFALNSLQVVIDKEPHRDRYGSMTTIDGVGIQTSVTINVAPGQPPLADQLLRLREAGAFAMLHAAGMDAMLPPWVVSGLASHAALIGQPQPAAKPGEFAPRGVAMGGQQWRWKRSAQDQLDEQPLDETQAGQMVSFLLTGNDAEHAPAFIAAVKQAVAERHMLAAEGNQITRRRGEADPPPTHTPFDVLAKSHPAQFEAWQADPLLGQPMFTPTADATAELAEAERQMLLVLKLLSKLTSTVEARTKVKVVTFDKAQGAAANTTTTRSATVGDLARRSEDLLLPPLATIDSEGRLLLTSDRRQMRELLGFDGQRYRSEQNGARSVVTTELSDDHQLQGWLEANPANPSRPIAKFAVVPSRTERR
ncbi:MAG: hypothetical protein SFU86_06205 [Pirellulaceae bacterium]|nr:hypothetical protein [Pirellulaceae bacterium]